MMKVILPELGEGIEQASVVCWHVRPGDTVKQDDDIVELVTDKASFYVAAGADGILKAILVADGQEARIGQALAEIETDATHV